jgi:dipeptidyl aminopeptidase/acylaminoacyl peptidase
LRTNFSGWPPKANRALSKSAGSTSYGQEFGNVIQFHYPGDDYKDLMLGVDEVIKRGFVDSKKVGHGRKRGGLLTNWVVGHTNRFAAAVAQRDIASWTDWCTQPDFTLFPPKCPPGLKRRRSRMRANKISKPALRITYINDVKTPMMFIPGVRMIPALRRVPAVEQMFRALNSARFRP